MSSGDQQPSKKKAGTTWPVAIVALVGFGWGLQGLWKNLFFPDPEFSQGYLIFSYALNGLAILACGTTLILFVIKLATQAKV
jgi:hypothetical protein